MNEKEPNHIIPRKKFMDAYLDSATELLRHVVNDGPELIQAWIMKEVDRTYKPRTASIIDNISYGNAELINNVDVLKFFNKYNQYVLTPSGSVYYPASRKRSVMYDFVQHYLAARKILKKEMLSAQEKGLIQLAQTKNYGQSTVKIRVNSIPGGTGSAYSFCYHKPSFNSVTSMSRNMIMNAYAFVERFLIGNFFFPSYDSLLNYIAVIGQRCPTKEQVDTFMETHGLYKPTSTEVFELLKGYLDIYTNNYNVIQLRTYLHGLPDHKQTFLFYANNFHLLSMINKDIIIEHAKKVFDRDLVDYSNIDNVDPATLFKQDGDLLIVLNTHYADILGEISLHDAPKDDPALARKLVCIAEHMQKCMDPLLKIASFFCNTKTTVDNVMAHKTMYRKVVTNSDTDSVIFTTKDWVEWYTGSYNFTKQAFDIDALITYLLSKSVGWLMYTMSEQRGAEGDDLYAMCMKNEFLYPVFMACTIPKHYAGPQTMREGHVLPKPDFDLKGVGFRGSALQKVTLDTAEQFVYDIIHTVYDVNHPEKIGEIDIFKFLQYVIDYEVHIIRSLKRGETSYLNVDPVKNKSEYTNPDSSIWFNYGLWCDVFEQKYGNIQIPTKCRIVPIDPTGITSPSYLEWLEIKSPEIHKKMIAFLDKANGKKISRIPLNPVLDQIPEEIIPLVNIKSIVHKNCSPMYLAFESLGVSSGIPSRKQVLFTDIYGVSEDYINGVQEKPNQDTKSQISS